MASALGHKFQATSQEEHLCWQLPGMDIVGHRAHWGAPCACRALLKRPGWLPSTWRFFRTSVCCFIVFRICFLYVHAPFISLIYHYMALYKSSCIYKYLYQPCFFTSDSLRDFSQMGSTAPSRFALRLQHFGGGGTVLRCLGDSAVPPLQRPWCSEAQRRVPRLHLRGLHQPQFMIGSCHV